MNGLVSINFHGDAVASWEEGEKIYACLKGMCENLGISWGSQHTKVTKSPLYSKHIRHTAIGTPGGEQQTLGLDIDYLPTWLSSISVERVKPAIREKLLAYQEECAQALRDYWFKGVAVQAPSQSNELARFDLMQLMLDEQRRAAEERAQIAAEQERQRIEQETIKAEVAEIKTRRPPEGRFYVEEWLRKNGKPYIPKEVLKEIKGTCRRMEDPKSWHAEWEDFNRNYYTPETIERAYALATKQISFIREAGVAYGRGR